MQKFRESDFQFHTDIASTGYKQYFAESDLLNVHAVLFEAKLSQSI